MATETKWKRIWWCNDCNGMNLL